MPMTLAIKAPLPAAPIPETHEQPRPPGAHAFAELLRQNRAGERASQPAEAAPADTENAAIAAPDAESAEAAAAAEPEPNPMPTPKGRGGTATRPATRGPARDAAAKADTESAEKKPAAERAPAEPAAPTDPAPGQWVAALPRTDTATATATATATLQAVGADAHAAAVERATAGDDAAALGRGKHGAATATGDANADPLAAARTSHRSDAATDAGAELRLAQSTQSALAALHEPRRADPPTRDASVSTAVTNVAALAPSSAPANAPTAAPATPVEVRVETPFATPEFAQALGLQVSTLARDGIHRAELRLNPVEMGPVSVRIALDGTQAQIDFGADTAATRHAIEAGLPELASALRDAGLTLTGGGVSQHSQGRRGAGQDGERGAAQGSPSIGSEAEPMRALRARVAASGGIDLYA